MVGLDIDGHKILTKFNTDKALISYEYKTEAYTEYGEGKNIDFTSTHNLRHDAQLKLTYNYGKGVTNWEEVQQSEVPEKAFFNLKMEESENNYVFFINNLQFQYNLYTIIYKAIYLDNIIIFL